MAAWIHVFLIVVIQRLLQIFLKWIWTLYIIFSSVFGLINILSGHFVLLRRLTLLNMAAVIVFASMIVVGMAVVVEMWLIESHCWVVVLLVTVIAIPNHTIVVVCRRLLLVRLVDLWALPEILIIPVAYFRDTLLKMSLLVVVIVLHLWYILVG